MNEIQSLESAIAVDQIPLPVRNTAVSFGDKAVWILEYMQGENQCIKEHFGKE